MTIRDTITTVFEQTAAAQGKRLEPLRDTLELMNSGLDSLCLAVIVARLERELGRDPFSAEDVMMPTTFGEFVSMYETAAVA